MTDFMNVTCAIAPQLTVATFLANGGYDHHLRRLRSAYRVQMEQMQAVITHSFPPETCISRPEGGHVLWLSLFCYYRESKIRVISNRRLSKDYELYTQNSEAMIYACLIRLLARRLVSLSFSL
jgi:hypothetical protein